MAGIVSSVQAQEFRAFWADAFHSGFKSASQINSMVSRAVTGNYNAIFVEALAYQDTGSGGHGAYWNSSILPKASDISSGFDPLATLVSAAHANGIEVHVWMVPFRVSTSWPPNGNSHVSTDMLMVSDSDIGTLARVGGKYILDPGNPDSQEYILSIVNELVTNYDIDGINLDYIRYEVSDAGYPVVLNNPKSSLERFKAITGYVGTPSNGVTSWEDFRRRGITEVVRRIYAEMHANKDTQQQPLMLSADLIAFGNAPSSFTSTSSYQLYQDWQTWVNNGHLDAALLMNYKTEWSGSQASWYRNWVTQGLAWTPADRFFFAGQGNYLNTKADSIAQMSYARNQGADGMVNYAYASTADENKDGVTEADYSWYSYVQANLYTSVNSVPEMFWHNPSLSSEACVWGQIVNETTGLPLDNAVVIANSEILYTDGNGYYVLPRVSTTSSGRTIAVSTQGDGCPAVGATATIYPADFLRVDLTLCPLETLIGDMDTDGDIDYIDFQYMAFCLGGEGVTYADGNFCLLGDFDEDDDIDMNDLAEFQLSFGAP